MVALGGATASTQKKMKTYGKPSRKRQLHQMLPVRTSDPYDFPDDIPPPETSAKPKAIPRPSTTKEPPKRPPIRVDSKDQRDCGSKPESTSRTDREESSDSRKRKRPQSSALETTKDSLTRSLSAPSIASTRTPDVGSRIPQKASPALKPVAPASVSRPLSRVENANKPLVEGPPSVKRSISQATTTNPVKPSPVKPSSVKPSPVKQKLQVRRPRLIDALAAQRAESPDSESCSDDDKPVSSFPSGNITPSQSNQASQESQPRPRARPGAKSQGKRPRLTYGQSRSILSESQTSNVTGMGSQEDALDALLATSPGLDIPDPFSFGDDEVDEDGDLRPAIKSVHELKRAGANNRFADEMEDLIARISIPNQSHTLQRRNGLLELAQKLQRKDFMGQFRDHATRDKVARKIGQEEDLVSGFALAAILVMFLTFNPAPHFLRELVDDGLWKLLSKLLGVSDDIAAVASQSKPKLSRANKISLGQLKTSLIRTQIWHGRVLEELSPETLSLQLLHILCQQMDPVYSAGVVKSLEGDLIAILGRYPKTEGEDDVTFPLVASILETQSSLAMDPKDETSWILQHSPKVAHFLQRTLQKWPNKTDDVESTVLKLAINTTNTSRGAASFNNEELLSSLSQCICAGFQSTQDAIINQRLRGDTYDGLLLILGVMINILEHCQAARRSVDDASVEMLITLYLQNQTSMNEVSCLCSFQLGNQ